MNREKAKEFVQMAEKFKHTCPRRYEAFMTLATEYNLKADKEANQNGQRD